MLKFKLTLFLFLFCSSLIASEDMQYDIALSTSTPYQNEAVILDINLTQTEHSKVMRFKFTLQKSDNYTFHQVAFKEYNKYHALRHTYRYLVYPKKSGQVALNFKLIKSLTNDDKVAYAISGDRDNVKGLEKDDFIVPIKPYILEVKALPKGVTLVGDFKFTQTLDREEVDAFDPVYLKAELKGEGNLEVFELLKESDKYHLFKQAPMLKNFYTREGTRSSINWDYAISSNKSFTLPKVLLKAFNPKTKKRYDLILPEHKIKIHSVEKRSLLDEENYPPSASKSIDWSWLSSLFSYIVVFMAGFLMPKEFFKRKKVMTKRDEEDILREKIEQTKTHKELLQLLLLENNLVYEEAIRELESVVYGKQRTLLSQIKKSIFK